MPATRPMGSSGASTWSEHGLRCGSSSALPVQPRDLLKERTPPPPPSSHLYRGKKAPPARGGGSVPAHTAPSRPPVLAPAGSLGWENQALTELGVSCGLWPGWGKDSEIMTQGNKGRTRAGVPFTQVAPWAQPTASLSLQSPSTHPHGAIRS